MKCVPILLVLVCSLLVADQAKAERVSTRLTRKKTDDHLYSFTIKVVRVKQNDLLQVHVIVKSKNVGGHILMPHRSGNLQVFNGKEFISSCHVQSIGQTEALSFSFRVAAKYADKSVFTFAETMGGPDDVDSFLQGFFYWFYLKDFVESK